MKLLALILLGLVCAIPHARAVDRSAPSGLPVDVAEYKERRDLCDHFRGEDPYDEERRKFLEENMKKFCVATDKELASLKTKYKKNEAVLKALSGYEDEVEGSK
jgi:hypothetical protein